MTLTIACTHCKKRLRIPDTALGKKVRCPLCTQVFVVAAEAPKPVAVEAIIPAKAVPPPLPAPPPARAKMDQEPGGERIKFAPIELGLNVKSDPAGELKGLFEGKVSRHGLSLRQKKKEIEIPVDSPTEYLGGNRLRLTVQDRQIEVAVLGQAFYQRVGQKLYVQRFTKDLGRFLSGNKQRLVIDDYKIPPFLMVLALVPFTLVFAAVGAVAADTNRGIIPGMLSGGLWGVIGALLSGLCVWACQKEEWPVAARAGISVGASVIGYGAFAIVLIAFSALNWKEFSPPGAGFTALMPGTPILKEQTAPGPVGPIAVHVYIVEKRNSAYLISYNDYPPQVLVNDVETLFDSVQQGGAAGVKGRVIGSKKISLGRYAGRETEIDVPGKGIMIVRYHLAGERFYQVGVIGPRVQADSEEVRKLFDSFKIQKQ